MDELNVNLLKHAKIDVADIKKTVQILNFGDTNEASSIKLMELDSELLKTVHKDDNISFRGDKKEELVFCSSEKTYDVKLADISNSIFLVPNLKLLKDAKESGTETNHQIENKYIKATLHQYFELTECPPRVSKLLSVLEPSTFKGLEFEKTVQKEDLYDWERIISEVQASDREIRDAFVDYSIAEIQGYYRLISFEFEARALTLMLDFVEENSWKPDEVDKDYTYDELSKFIPRAVFDLIFHKYTNPSKETDSGNQLYVYNEEKCCKLLARVLLTACPVSEHKHFMQAWTLGTPEYMKPKPEYLHGVAIIVNNPQKMKQEVMVFLETALPDNIEERFNELFKAKSKWTLEEISPYLKKLCTPQINESTLLTKYSRCSTISGVKYYCSKHDK